MKRTILIALFAALGLAAAMLVTPARGDDSNDYRDLPSQGFTLTVIPDFTHTPVCQNVWAQGNGSPLTLLGDPDSTHLCQTDAAMLANVAALKAAWPRVTTAAVTTAVATTAASTTTAAPSTTDTTPITVTTPTTVTVTIVDPTIDQRLTALEAGYAALSARVDAIAKANTASWDAYIAAVGAGASAVDAATAARSAGLNAIYAL